MGGVDGISSCTISAGTADQLLKILLLNRSRIQIWTIGESSLFLKQTLGILFINCKFYELARSLDECTLNALR